MLDKSFVIRLAAFAAIAFSLFTIFHVSFSQFGKPDSLIVFIAVVCLLAACNMLEFIVISFFGFSF